MLLSPRLQKLHADSLVARHWMVFLKTRPFVKRNNAEYTNVSSFTSLLTCSTHFTQSCRILPFSLPTTNNFFKFVYSEITGKSAWRVLFRPPWCCLLLWQLKFIRIGLTTILDFWYPGPSYLVQEVLVLYFFFLYLVSCTQKNALKSTLLFFLYLVSCTQKNALKRAQFSRYSTTFFFTILQFSSELSKNWGTGLPSLCPSWIYFTGQQHKASLFLCLFSCLSSLCLQLLHHLYKSCHSTLAPLRHHSSRTLTSLF